MDRAELMDPPVIFVVDDDASVRDAIRRLLLSIRAQIHLYASAEEFLADTPAGTDGCLILDLRLPGIDGLQLLEQLADQHWKLPTIVVTAHHSEEVRDEALRLGAVSCLRKPFDRAEFLKSIHAALAQSQS